MIAAAVAFFGLSLLSAPAPAAKKYESPIAVMPFKNLNEDAATDWLEKGIAETMISDLKKAGSATTVVERSQVERALAEIALQGREVSSSEAAGVGKLLGAKTIVLGAYQQSGKQMRINARFVAVETGVVLETAKVTGSIEGVFALQDQIVDKLLGVTKAPAARPKRKSTAQAVEAYRLYAMSLSTATDAERVGLLKKSVAADPDFSYALADLAALEKRMAAYQKASVERLDAHDRMLRDRLLAPDATAEQKTQLATTLMQSLFLSRRYYAAIEETRRIREMRIPQTSPQFDVTEHASLYEFLALEAVGRHDEMLRAGERHLQEHATGTTYRMVEMKMNMMVKVRRDFAVKRKAFDQLLLKLDAERAKPQPASDRPSLRPAGFDMDACTGSRDLGEPKLVFEHCGGFVEKWKGDRDPAVLHFVQLAKWTVTMGHASAGDYAKAREHADELFEKEAEFASSVALRTTVDSWPVDAP